MSVIIFGKRCKICRLWKPRSEFYRVTKTQGNICSKCGEWHEQALLLLGRGIPPRGCQECGVTFESLAAGTKGDNVGMYLHPKDGIYQILCARCSAKYAPRSGIYEDTAYEHRAKLKGYK